jgi:hypothetical protein
MSIATWQDRAIAATRGNQTQFGTILLNALNRNQNGAFPQFHGRASLTVDGYVLCNFTDRDGHLHHGAFMGELADVVRNTDDLAAHLHLSDEERASLRGVIERWLGAKQWRNDARS